MAMSLVSLAFLSLIFLPLFSNAISQCNGPCQSLDDCAGQLICIDGKCRDEPHLGPPICPGGPTTPYPEKSCQPSGMVSCEGIFFPTYTCSPPVTSFTKAKLTNNDFGKDDERGQSMCDGRFQRNSKPIVALSTGWYDRGSRCGKIINITAKNGRSVLAKVVDECDSTHGCDEEHAHQPPCGNNIIDGSDAVWEALGLDKYDGVADVTWCMA